MADWQSVDGRGNRTRRKKCTKVEVRESRQSLSEDDVKRFLSDFKTSACSNDMHHDFSLCPHFHHGDTDRRRNPYEQYYDLDACVNPMETMYHPAIFRTTYCQRRGEQLCRFGKFCAHAHTEDDLRDRKSAILEYDCQPVKPRPQPSLSLFLPAETRRDYRTESNALWQQVGVQRLYISTVFLTLNEAEWFLVDRSQPLFSQIEETVFEDGLGFVSRQCDSRGRGLLIKGLHSVSIQSSVKALFETPSIHFAMEERQYGERIIASLKELMKTTNGKQSIARSADVLVQVENTGMRVYGVHSTEQPGDTLVQEVFAKIAFWIEREKYDCYLRCSCCCEDRNPDQGVACRNNHFYCSVEECFSTAIFSQINLFSVREGGFACPECDLPYDSQDMAKHLPPEVWNAVQTAIVDKDVKKENAKLSKEFDARVETRVQEVMSKYGTASERLVEEGTWVETLLFKISDIRLVGAHHAHSFAPTVSSKTRSTYSTKQYHEFVVPPL
jgi:hypothetical protein